MGYLKIRRLVVTSGYSVRKTVATIHGRCNGRAFRELTQFLLGEKPIYERALTEFSILSFLFSYRYLTANVAEDPALCAVFLTLISVILIVVSLPFSLFFCVKVSQSLLFSMEHENVVMHKKIAVN